jgi:hypothetical protein
VKSATTALGNSFFTSDSTDDYLGSHSGDVGVISGDGLLLDGGSNHATFVWALATPSNAFGFFTYDNDNGDVTIKFDDGGLRTYRFTANGRIYGRDSSFWGITGLTSLVTSVTITTTDKGHTSTWDNFVTAQPHPVVPEPSMFVIWGTLSGLGLIAARRRK